MLRFVAAVLLMSLVVFTTSACRSQSTTKTQVPPGAYAMSYLEMEEIGYRPGWNAQTLVNPGSRIVGAAVLGPYFTVVEHPANIVTTFDLKTGDMLWKMSAGQPGEKIYGPYQYKDRIMVNTDRQLWAFDAKSGELRIIGDFNSVVRTEPAMSERLAIFGGADGKAFAIDVTTAQKPWEYQMAASFRAKPLKVANGVFVADVAGVYAMLDELTGNLLWRGRTFGPIVADPAADTIRIYIPSEDRALYALDRTSGRDRWTPFRAPMALTESPLAASRDVFLPLPGEGLVALQAGTGREIWRKPLLVKPEGVVGRFLFARDDQSIYKINPADGDVLATAAAPLLAKFVIAPENRLIVVSNDGIVTEMVPTN